MTPNDQPPLVSVVIPTRSRPHAVVEAVASVFAGAYQRFELFVIDQSPDDETRVALAGFMRVLKGDFLRAFESRIVNIHPSLLPSFPGLDAWKQALDHGVRFTGCTVHFVDAGVDAGPIIGQQTVPVLDDDTPETLHQRIHAAEHELYPNCVAAIARGDVSVRGRRVIWKGA